MIDLLPVALFGSPARGVIKKQNLRKGEKDKEDAVRLRYIACHAITNRRRLVALLLKDAVV